MPAGKIDVHAHYVPEVYRDALVAEGGPARRHPRVAGLE